MGRLRHPLQPGARVSYGRARPERARALRARRGSMTPSRKAPTDSTDDATEVEVVVDALTGEVRTLTAAEIAAEEEEERSGKRRPMGVSPELFSDPYGEE